MMEVDFSFNNEMRELFDYPDPSVPVIVWMGDFCELFNRCLAYHWHNEFEYCVVLSGTLGFTIDGHYMEINAGDAVFVNSNAMHSAAQVGDVPAKVFTVSFLPAILTDNEYSTVYRKYFLPILQSPVKGFLIDRSRRYTAELLRDLSELYALFHKREHDFELMCISLVSRVWSLTLSYLGEYGDTVSFPHTRHQNEEIARSILNYIHNHYSEDIRIDDMAKSAGTSRSGCFRSFRSYTNKSPTEYLTEYRIARAMTLMAGGESLHNTNCCGVRVFQFQLFRKAVSEKTRDNTVRV